MPGLASPIPMKPPVPSSPISFPTMVSILFTLMADSSYLLSMVRETSSDWLMHFVMTSMVSQTCFMLSTISWLEDSTSFMAPSITLIFSPSVVESLVILVTLSFTSVNFSRVVWISSSVCVIDCVIFPEVSSKWVNASRMRPEEFLVSTLSPWIWSATTAKPFPAAPALAASMEAFKARRFVWKVIPSIVPVSSFTISKSCLKFSKTCSTCADRSAIVLVVVTTSASSSALKFACSMDSWIRFTIFSIRAATFCTCMLISEVLSMEDIVFV